MTQRNMDSLLTSALEIATRRASLLDRVRKSLLQSDTDTALTLMRQYCGIITDEKSNRVN